MPGQSCKIRIETGRTILGAASMIEQLGGPLYLLYDNAVKPLAGSLSARLEIKAAKGVEGGEGVKTLASAEEIAGFLLDAGAGREATLIVMGGGAVCDAGAFTASIYKRGIKFVLIPTTLLAQVDAAIGGKTAVNSRGIKNPLGTFALPEFTYICPEPLATLPSEQWRSGAAELLKTLLLRGSGYEEAVELLAAELARAGAAPEHEHLHELIIRAAHIKAEIVSEDFLDTGARRLLNLGHTFGHAIEALALEKGAPILHGEAVAIGMLLSARIAGGPFAGQLKADLQRLGLPTECPFTQEELLPLIRQDKKAECGKIRFILLHGPGRIEEVSIEPRLPLSHE
ncbi:MAG: 3-dehydroquinate synthase [Bacteroidales bacterium]|nr:3-dehydroquinate synthase [Bacteroidales bacterium]